MEGLLVWFNLFSACRELDLAVRVAVSKTGVAVVCVGFFSSFPSYRPAAFFLRMLCRV